MVTAALILHNMCVSDRIMDGDPRALYNPAHSRTQSQDGDLNVDQPDDLEEVQARGRRGAPRAAVTGVDNADEEVMTYVTRRQRWLELRDKEECGRLHRALMAKLGA